MVSIIIPFYNGNKYIPKLVDNINKIYDNYRNIEVIIVNDSPEVLVDIENVYIKFSYKIIINPKNKGIHFSRVNGLKHANGEYIIFLDQDDYIEKNFINSQLIKIKNYDCIIANGYNYGISNRKKIYKNSVFHKLSTYFAPLVLTGTHIISPGQCLIKKESIPKYWLENIMNINGVDDAYLWFLMYGENKKFTINKDCLYHHIYTGKNLSFEINKMISSLNEMHKLLTKSGKFSGFTLKFIKRRINSLNNFGTIKSIIIFPDVYFFKLIRKILRSI